jgi:hypothetical protein
VIVEQGHSAEVNKWVLDTLRFTKDKYKADRYDPRRNDVLAFRLLTIKYRATFPRKGPHVALQQ